MLYSLAQNRKNIKCRRCLYVRYSTQVHPYTDKVKHCGGNSFQREKYLSYKTEDALNRQPLLVIMAQRMNYVEPNRGDLIEILRGTFYHWAIYVGNGYVIHLTTPGGLPSSHPSLAGSSGTTSVLNEMGIVKKEILFDVVGTDTFCVKNHLDNMHQPRSVSTILSDAESRVGKTVPYDVFQYNCEHFVTELRYGKPESRQVQQAAEVGGPAMFGAGLLGAFAAFASVIVMSLLRNS